MKVKIISVISQYHKIVYNFLKLDCRTVVRVARSTFYQGAKSSLEKSQILRQGANERANHFSKQISSYKVV